MKYKTQRFRDHCETSNNMRCNIVFLRFVVSEITNAEGPNILVILLDDLGWADVSWNNHVMQTTPFLKTMAENGTILVCRDKSPFVPVPYDFIIKRAKNTKIA